MRLNFKLILYIIGLLLIFNGSAMILTAIVSLIFSDGVVNEISVEDGQPVEFGQTIATIV